jgi:hypothetical protein
VAIDDELRRIHAAMVTELDSAIGRLVDALDQEDMLENTLIWFFSDNGGLNPTTVAPPRMSMVQQLVAMYGRPLPLPMLEFMRQNFEEGRGDNTPLKLGKRSFYEGGVRVPALGLLAGGNSAERVASDDHGTGRSANNSGSGRTGGRARRSHSTDLHNGRQFRVRKTSLQLITWLKRLRVSRFTVTHGNCSPSRMAIMSCTT